MASEELTQRTLVIVAHPDDDVIGCGGLLQRIEDPMLVFCTDGAPRDSHFWCGYGSRERYSEARRQEARSALKMAGIFNPVFLSEVGDKHQFIDQDLFLAVPNAMPRILALIDEFHPTVLLTHAYEGGHPDHDTCCFLAHAAGEERQLPVWEFPLYHRNKQGEFRLQEFLAPNGTELMVHLTEQELEVKRGMMAAYASQEDVLAQFDPAVECFRPMAAYDFSLPPHHETLNYEAWGWPITGKQVCAAFAACSHKRSLIDQAMLPPIAA